MTPKGDREDLDLLEIPCEFCEAAPKGTVCAVCAGTKMVTNKALLMFLQYIEESVEEISP